MFGLSTGWTLLIALCITLAGTAGGYLKGRADGDSACEARYAEAAKDAEKAEGEKQSGINAEREKSAAAENVRQEAVREVYRETVKLVDRPVYRNRCLDADGVFAIDLATAAANGANRPSTAGDAAPSPSDPAQR